MRANVYMKGPTFWSQKQKEVKYFIALVFHTRLIQMNVMNEK